MDVISKARLYWPALRGLLLKGSNEREVGLDTCDVTKHFLLFNIKKKTSISDQVIVPLLSKFPVALTSLLCYFF